MEQLEPLAPFEEPSRADFYRALGRAIKVTRAEQGLERKELSRLSGVSYPYLSEIEKGKKRPSTEAVRALASALGLRQSELLERAERALERIVPRGASSIGAPREGGRLPEEVKLSPTQKRVLELVVAGNSNAGIARRLGVSEGTVKTHLSNIYARLEVSSRVEASRLAHDLALGDPVSNDQPLQELLVRVRRLGADDLPRVLDLVRRLTR